MTNAKKVSVAVLLALAATASTQASASNDDLAISMRQSASEHPWYWVGGGAALIAAGAGTPVVAAAGVIGVLVGGSHLDFVKDYTSSYAPPIEETCKAERDFYPTRSEFTRAVLAQSQKTRAENVAEYFRTSCEGEPNAAYAVTSRSWNGFGTFKMEWDEQTKSMQFSCVGGRLKYAVPSTDPSRIRDGLVRKITFEGDFIHFQAQRPKFGYNAPGLPDYCVHHVPISAEYNLIKKGSNLD
ncbi:MAG: hypothetical protein AB1540_15225 [Bdellovibrionota bacterium]